MNERVKAILLALFVVFLWATSWVLIKIGLKDLPPLTFAGLRYVIAFLTLLGIVSTDKTRYLPERRSNVNWKKMVLLGILFYGITQGASFVALAYLPAVTVNLLWNFSSITTAVLGIFLLSEIPTQLQWGGVLLALIGAVIFFYPTSFPDEQYIGLGAAVAGVLANAFSSILGRDINRSGNLHPLLVTVVSMGVGSMVLLGTGISLEGLPTPDLRGWGIIIWLALINTALAFTLWNHTLRILTAVESSIINSTMLIWIPIFAVLFLGESISGKELAGLLAAGAGTLIVQLRRIPVKMKTSNKSG